MRVVQVFPRIVLLLLLFQSTKIHLWGWPSEKSAYGLSVHDQIFETADRNKLLRSLCSSGPCQKCSSLCSRKDLSWIWVIGAVAAVSIKHLLFILVNGSLDMLTWCKNPCHCWRRDRITQTVQIAHAHFPQGVPRKAELWHKTNRIYYGGISLHTLTSLKFSLDNEAFLICILPQTHP